MSTQHGVQCKARFYFLIVNRIISYFPNWLKLLLCGLTWLNMFYLERNNFSLHFVVWLLLRTKQIWLGLSTHGSEICLKNREGLEEEGDYPENLFWPERIADIILMTEGRAAFCSTHKRRRRCLHMGYERIFFIPFLFFCLPLFAPTCEQIEEIRKSNTIPIKFETTSHKCRNMLSYCSQIFLVAFLRISIRSVEMRSLIFASFLRSDKLAHE